MVQVGPRAATSTATDTETARPVTAPDAVLTATPVAESAPRRRYSLEIPINPESICRFWR